MHCPSETVNEDGACWIPDEVIKAINALSQDQPEQYRALLGDFLAALCRDCPVSQRTKKGS